MQVDLKAGFTVLGSHPYLVSIGGYIYPEVNVQVNMYRF